MRLSYLCRNRQRREQVVISLALVFQELTVLRVFEVDILVAKSCLHGNLSELLAYGEKTCHVLLVALGIAAADSGNVDVEVI